MTRKKLLMLLGSVCLALMLVAMACAAPTPSPTPTPTPSPSPPTPSPSPSPTPAPTPTEEVYEWRLQVYVPAGILKYDVSVPRYIERIESASNGRIHITQFPAGAIVPALDTFQAVADGTLEMGYSAGYYEMGAIPIAELLFGWPYAFKDFGELVCFEKRMGLIEIAERAYHAYNLQPLAYHSGPYNGDLMSKVPLTNYKDLKGLKIRSGGAMAEIFQECGAGVISCAGAEMYTALATGTIDAATYSPISVFYDYGLHEVTKYHIGPPMMPIIGCGFLVNLELWNSLPDDLKTILEMASEEYMIDYFADFYARDAEATKSMIEDYGVTFLTWDDETTQEFTRISFELLDEKATIDEYWAEAVPLLKDYLKSLGRL